MEPNRETGFCRPAPGGARLADLRARIARIEAGGAQSLAVLPFGVAALDSRLPGGGLALAALHEIAGGDADAAAATLFAAGIAARTRGPLLWCVARADLFAPGLAQAGLAAARVIQAEAGSGPGVLAAMEEGLRHGGLAAVVGEVARLPLVASRRLHLAARASGTPCLAIRRQLREDCAQPSAALTRWRITALPSTPLPVAGVGRPRWRVQLLRARGGGCLDLELEACDGTGHLAVPADVADRSVAAAGGPIRAAG